MTYRVREERYQHLYRLKKTGEFDIMNDISEHVTPVQLVDTAGNVNHVVSIIACWIYDSNYKIALL